MIIGQYWKDVEQKKLNDIRKLRHVSLLYFFFVSSSFSPEKKKKYFVDGRARLQTSFPSAWILQWFPLFLLLSSIQFYVHISLYDSSSYIEKLISWTVVYSFEIIIKESG